MFPALPAFITLLVLAVCAGPGTGVASAATHASADRLEAQRRAFLDAERALGGGRRAEFERLSETLRDYPLHPYLVYADLRRRLPRAGAPELRRFLEAHDGTPLATRLRATWLDRLAAARRWKTFLEEYRHVTGAKRRCQRLQALTATGRGADALDATLELWLSARSQPKDCDPPFAAFAKSGRLTSDLAWQRVELAMSAGQTRLARYLERFLDAEPRALAARWRALRANPARIADLAATARTDPRAEAVIVDVLRRVAGRDPERADTLWSGVDGRTELDGAARARVVARIALGYSWRHDPRAIDRFESVPELHVDDTTAQWRIVAALRHAEWRLALQWIEALPPDEDDKTRWTYWRARALDALGEVDRANALYRELAGERDYYGFLAADRIAAPYRLGSAPLEVDATVLARVDALPGVARARELLALDRRLDARREWYALARDMDAASLAAAASIAHRWGWHGRAILTVARSGEFDDLDLRFPLAFRTAVERGARKEGLDPAWVFAVIRQESAFMADARSPAGALGLMQIMPRTGRGIARALDTRLTRNAQLLDPETSVRFGSHYLRSLLDRFGGHRVLAIAAYNAGPHRVEGWRPDGGSLDADVWIEHIQFRETRRYVRRVLTYTAIYEHRLGGEARRLSERLVPVPGRGVARVRASDREAS